MDKSRSPSLLGLIITVVLLSTSLVYLFVSLNTQDPLWFVSSFSELPTQVVVNCYGEPVFIRPNDARYDGLVAKVNEILSGRKYWDQLTLSEDTYQEYQDTSEMMIIELFYAPRVRIHSFYKYFSNLDSIVVPLDGRHASTYAVFGRVNNTNTAGSLHFDNVPQIRVWIETQGICVKP
ncbi:MAG: hypothetical protein H6636_09860 [Anaerolineales bacterium]|nr:hypothetical protein [Anaerolineales bacterium]